MEKRSASDFETNTFSIWRLSLVICHLLSFCSASIIVSSLPLVVTAQEKPVDAAIAAGTRRITLEEAKQQAVNAAVNSPGARLAQLAAEAKASQAATQIITSVEQLYYRLLIAERRRSSAEAEVKSLIGVVASYNVFDFGKRERTVRERKTQLAMAEEALSLARAQVSAGVQKTHLELERAAHP
jgi:hypothetical protein